MNRKFTKYLALALPFCFLLTTCDKSTGSDTQPIATGAWSATTGSGLSFDFTISAGADEITEITYHFSGLQCGGVTLASGSIGSQRTPGWSISNRRFEIARTSDPAITISGSFHNNGTEASGDWEWLTCSGTWTASH